MDWQVPGYDELRDLGGGAQGRVVLASERGGGGLRAVKYLARAATTLEREAAALARVHDPHVARIHGYEAEPGGDGGALIMEMVEGYALDAVLAARVALEPRAALVLFKHVLLGLAAAHAAGVPHRDCKPANVIVRPDGTAVLVGFGGTAHLEDEDGAGRAGTPAYRAPEQWTGAPANPATDLYAATCVFFECLTGAPPYQASAEAELQQLHQNASPPIERLPKALRPPALRGLAKFPAQRPLDALAFVSDLEKTARRAYGRKWESRGLASLLGLAAAMAGTGAHPVVAGAARQPRTGRAALVFGAIGLAAVVAAGAAVYSASGEPEGERSPVAAPLAQRPASAVAEVVFVEEELPGERIRVATVAGLPPELNRKVNTALRARVDALLRESRPGLSGGRIRVRSSLGFRSAGLASVLYAFSVRPGRTDGPTREFTTRFAVTVDLATGAEITPSRIFPESALPELNRRIMKVAEDPRGCFDEEPLALTAANLEHVLEPAFVRKGMQAALLLAESGPADRYSPGCRRTEELVPYRMLLDLMAPDFRAKLGR
ncbi:serine/threonine-protein kinase [Actinocorallia populi]|uniref:serine/threonine-protein kinase n=1 Tax=Actinocorallia populi TaxID=2079200 RepID=UPI0018E5849F|nr:serine/threonine-protein kinase [Actinocorallia populi]